MDFDLGSHTVFSVGPHSYSVVFLSSTEVYNPSRHTQETGSLVCEEVH